MQFRGAGWLLRAHGLAATSSDLAALSLRGYLILSSFSRAVFASLSLIAACALPGS